MSEGSCRHFKSGLRLTVPKPLRDHLWAVNLSVACDRVDKWGQEPAPIDADLLIRWYYRLHREYVAARRNGRPFVNPLRPRLLRYLTSPRRLPWWHHWRPR